MPVQNRYHRNPIRYAEAKQRSGGVVTSTRGLYRIRQSGAIIRQFQARSAYNSADRSNALAAVTIPSLGQDVPLAFTINNIDTAAALADLAEAALDLELIQSSDWTQDLADSINLGLQRSLHGMLIPGQTDLLVCVTTRDEWLEAAQKAVIEEKAGTTQSSITSVSIDVATFSEYYLQDMGLELDSIYPDLGVHVLRSFFRVANWLGYGTPMWIMSEIEMWDQGDDEEAAQEGYLTEKLFRELWPIRYWGQDTTTSGDYPTVALPDIDQEVLNGAWNAIKKHGEEDYARILELATELATVKADHLSIDHTYSILKSVDEDNDLDIRNVLPASFRWSKEDRVDQTVDGYHDMIANSGEQNDTLYTRIIVAGVEVGTEYSAVTALAAVKEYFELTAKIDELAQLLHSEPKPERTSQNS